MVISTLGVTVPAWALPPSPVRTRAMIGPAPVAPAAPTTPLRPLEPAPAASQAATLAFKVSMYLASGTQTGMLEPPPRTTMDISARHVLLVHCVPLMLRAVMAVETRMACADTHHAPRPLAAW